MILEIRDYLREYPVVYPAQGVNANAEFLLVIDVEITDTPFPSDGQSPLPARMRPMAGLFSKIAHLLMISLSE